MNNDPIIHQDILSAPMFDQVSDYESWIFHTLDQESACPEVIQNVTHSVHLEQPCDDALTLDTVEDDIEGTFSVDFSSLIL